MLLCTHIWIKTEEWTDEDGTQWTDYECGYCGAEKSIAIWNKPKEQYRIYNECEFDDLPNYEDEENAELDDNRTENNSP